MEMRLENYRDTRKLVNIVVGGNIQKSLIILSCLIASSCGYELQDTSALANKSGNVFLETTDRYSSFIGSSKYTEIKWHSLI